MTRDLDCEFTVSTHLTPPEAFAHDACLLELDSLGKPNKLVLPLPPLQWTGALPLDRKHPSSPLKELEDLCTDGPVHERSCSHSRTTGLLTYLMWL